MALFHAKFACNLAFRNPIFRWESCKGSVWESVKKCSRLCSEVGTRDWISWVAYDLQAARRSTWMEHAEELDSHTSWSTTGQKVQTGHSVSSQLELATQSSHEAKSPASLVLEKWLFAFQTHTSVYKPLYPRNVESFQKELWERNPREKQDWLIHNLHPCFSKFLYSHPLHCYILERYISQIFFSPYPYLWKGFLVIGKQLGRDQLILVDAMGYSGIW